MIQLPFTRDYFSQEAKNRLSGINVNLEYDNIESGLMKAAISLRDDTFGRATYDAILNNYIPGGESSPLLDCLQRGMLHMTIYNEMAFLMVRIGNDGITTKKSNDETTIFKYQQDDLENTLINNAWFWLGKAIQILNDSPGEYPDWQSSAQKAELDSLPVTLADFRKWVGIDNLYFLTRIRWIIREVWMDNVLPRFNKGTVPIEFTDNVHRAVVYQVMETAVQRLAYADLPENIRRDIANEQEKPNKDKSEDHIREKVSRQFSTKALRYWSDIDNKLVTSTGRGNYEFKGISPADKFGFL